MRKSAFILLAVVFAAAGCRKDGQTGPQGPAGNANVETYFYVADSASWATNNSGISWFTGLSVPEIDQGVINSGAVMIYWVDTTATSTSTISYNYQLPYYDNGDSVNFSAVISNYDATNNPSNVTVYVSSTNGIAILDPGYAELRVVIIPSLEKKGFVAPKGWTLIQSTVKR